MNLTRVRRAAHRHVGRRGAALIGFGIVDAVYGASLISHSGVVPNATARWFETIGPMWLWVGLWWAVAVFCFASAVVTTRDVWGFLAAIGLKVWWVILCFAGWRSGEVGLGAVGLWFGLAYFAALFAGWPEPAETDENAS